MQPRIVCAANRYPDGTVLLGARHWDSWMVQQARALRKPVKPAPTQGFIDQFGNFYSREAAWEIAKAADQIVRRCGGDYGILFSENLY